MIKRIFFIVIGFLGWILSPFTWWNDAFVNLPLAHISASLVRKFVRLDFLTLFLISYWFTNILGILLMYAGAKGLSPKGLIKNKAIVVLITVLIYSIIAALIIRSGIIRPF